MSMTNRPVEVLTLVTLCDSEWVKSCYTAVTIMLVGSIYVSTQVLWSQILTFDKVSIPTIAHFPGN